MVLLAKKDYLEILRFYNIETSGMKTSDIIVVAKDILANKLCRCIKKINNTDEPTAIAICKNSILTKKRLKIGRFKCAKGAMFIPNKTTGATLSKINTTRKKLVGTINKVKRR
jgi:hypothetical protein